jgi:hypothetical protein
VIGQSFKVTSESEARAKAGQRVNDQVGGGRCLDLPMARATDRTAAQAVISALSPEFRHRNSITPTGSAKTAIWATMG